MFTLLACADLSFYADPVDDLAAHAPGDVLRSEPIASVSAGTLGWYAGELTTRGAEVHRVLYRTVGVDGAPDVASARVAIPDDVDPTVLVAHLHGTVGLADPCAPSLEDGLGFEASVNPHAARMLAEGRVVVEPPPRSRRRRGSWTGFVPRAAGTDVTFLPVDGGDLPVAGARRKPGRTGVPRDRGTWCYREPRHAAEVRTCRWKNARQGLR